MLQEHHVRVKPLFIDKFLRTYFVISGLAKAEKDSRSDVIRFIIALNSLWIHAVRLYLWAHLPNDCKVSILTGDFTVSYTEPKEWLASMTTIWLASVFFAGLNSLMFHFEQPGAGDGILSRFSQQDYFFECEVEVRSFVELHKLLTGIIRLCRNLVIVSSVMITAFRFLPIVNQSLEYILGSLVWYPLDLIYTAFVTATVAISGSFFMFQCYYYVTELQRFEERLRERISNQNFLDFKKALAESSSIQREIRATARFWRRSSGILFIGMFFAYCLNLYQVCFLQYPTYLKIILLFWGSCSFVCCCLVPVVSGAYLYTYLKTLSRRLMTICPAVGPPRLRLALTNTMFSLSSFKPFTCLGMFSFQWRLIPKMFAEIAMNLMLLYTIQSRWIVGLIWENQFAFCAHERRSVCGKTLATKVPKTNDSRRQQMWRGLAEDAEGCKSRW